MTKTVEIPKKRSINPTGFRVLVYPDPLETKTAGGIYLPQTDERLKKAAQQTGTLVAVGPIAWHAFDKEHKIPWAYPGQRVFYVKYGGMFVEDPITKDIYVLLNDEDISGVLMSELVDNVTSAD